MPGLAIIVFLLTSISVDLIFHNDEYFASHRWPRLVAFWIMGLLVWYVGRSLNKKEARVVIDKKTGEEFTLKSEHSFVFISLQHWAYLLFVLGIVFLFIKA